MNTPTLTELYNSVLNDLQSELGVTIPVFGKNFLRVFAAVQAGKLKLIYLSIAFVQRNVFPDLADSESVGGTLERFGRIKLGRERFSATSGVYTIELNGIDGSTIPAGSLFKSNDDSASPSKIFQSVALGTVSSGVVTVQVQALEGGLDSRLAVNDNITSVSPLLNIDDVAVVISEDTIPLDQESIENYRTAILNSFRLEPQGGSGTDYRLWSADAQGVQEVYPYAKSGGVNEVDVYVEATIADSVDGKGTPSAALLVDVEDVINFDPDTTQLLNQRGRRPLTAILDVLPISPKDVIITINNPTNIDQDDENNIESALSTYVNGIRPFVGSADLAENQNDVISLNGVITAISNVLTAGKNFDSVDITVDGNAVTSSLQFTLGDIPFFDSVTFN